MLRKNITIPLILLLALLLIILVIWFFNKRIHYLETTQQGFLLTSVRYRQLWNIENKPEKIPLPAGQFSSG
jgi:hypothetical protein